MLLPLNHHCCGLVLYTNPPLLDFQTLIKGQRRGGNATEIYPKLAEYENGVSVGANEERQ